jgi:hypothetical protein
MLLVGCVVCRDHGCGQPTSRFDLHSLGTSPRPHDVCLTTRSDIGSTVSTGCGCPLACWWLSDRRCGRSLLRAGPPGSRGASRCGLTRVAERQPDDRECLLQSVMARVNGYLHRGSWKIVCIWTQAAGATAELRTAVSVDEPSAAISNNTSIDDAGMRQRRSRGRPGPSAPRAREVSQRLDHDQHRVVLGPDSEHLLQGDETTCLVEQAGPLVLVVGVTRP